MLGLLWILTTPAFALPHPPHPHPPHHGRRALPRLGGVNLAGCDFGVTTNGKTGSFSCPPASQIGHFTGEGANLIRLPIGWEYLIGSMTDPSSTSFDSTVFATYNNLVQTTTNTGAYAIIDIHNYARWEDTTIVGQSGTATNQDFANLWSLIATQYKNNDRVIFGLMNEPHNLDVSLWATTCQTAVNAIRAAGANSQVILLPGTVYDSGGEYLNGDNDPLLSITDPATGDTSLLLFDVHKYYDATGAGTARECVTDGVSSTWTPLKSWLNSHGRKAIVSETGGGNTDSCIQDVGSALSYISSNSDAYAGFAVWAAGSFSTSYNLSITPNADGSDNALFTQAIKPYLPGL